METVFVVCGASGDYSSHNEWNVVATDTESIARQLVNDLNELVLVKQEHKKQLHEFEDRYRKTYPPPEYGKPTDEFRKYEKMVQCGAKQKDKDKFKQLQKEHIERREQQ